MHTQKAKAVKVALISPEGAPFFFWMLPLTRTEGVEILTHTLKVLIYSTVVLPGSPICKRCLNWTLRSTSKWQHAIFFLAKCVYFLPNLHNAHNPFCPQDSILKEKRRKKEKEKHDTIIKNLSNYIWALENVKMVNNIYISTSAIWHQENVFVEPDELRVVKYRRMSHGAALYLPLSLVNKGNLILNLPSKHLGPPWIRLIWGRVIVLISLLTLEPAVTTTHLPTLMGQQENSYHTWGSQPMLQARFSHWS